MTIQVAPDDCNGCGVCVDVCPAKQASQSGTSRSTWSRRRSSTGTASGSNWDFFKSIPEFDRDAGQDRDDQGLADARAAVRVLGRVRWLRRDALPQAGDPTVRRPDARRQRHRVLVDLRWQPAHHSVVGQRTRAAGRRGPTRCSKTTPSSASACGSRSSRGAPPGASSASWRNKSAPTWLRRSSRRPGDRGQDRCQRRRVSAVAHRARAH